MKKIILLFLCTTSISVLAQQEVSVFGKEKSSKKEKKNIKVDKKPNNITDYSDQLNLKLFTINKTNLVAHHDGFTQNTYEYKPNEAVGLGVGLGYKWLGLDMAFNFPFLNDDDDVYGKTTRFDLQFNVYMQKFVVDFNFQTYQGYYNSNPHHNDPNYVQGVDPYPIRPNMQTVNLGLQAFYIFNHEHFSYRAAFIFNERQIKSAGSFLAGTYINFYEITNAEFPLVPSETTELHDPEADFRQVGYSSIGLSGGYAHTFIIFKKFFISLSVAVGFGVESAQRKESEDFPEYQKSGRGAFVVGRGSIGYNGEKWYAGFSTVNTESSSPDEYSSYLERSVSNFKLFVGRRLNPPKFLTQSK